MSVQYQYHDPVTNRNRRKKLKERMRRLVDKADMPNNQKVFLKLSLSSIIEEYANLWEVRKENRDKYPQIWPGRKD